MKRSKPLRRSTPEKVNDWRRRSKRLASTPKPNPVLADARVIVEQRARGLCEANVPDVCPPGRHRGSHAHHVRLKGQGGPDTPGNLVWICPTVHEWIHAHPIDAHARGLIRWTGDAR